MLEGLVRFDSPIGMRITCAHALCESRKAKDLDVNLSGAFEQAEEIVPKRLQERWLEENREAIAAYNEYFETHPVFSAGLRSF